MGAAEWHEGASNYQTLVSLILCRIWHLQNAPYKVAVCVFAPTLLRSQAGGYGSWESIAVNLKAC